MKTKVFALIVVGLLGNQAMAQGMLSTFELTQGSTSECPLILDVTRKGSKIIVETINSQNMNGVGPFANTLYFSEINKGWQTVEMQPSYTFLSNTELLIGSSEADLKKTSKLLKGDSTLRETAVSLKVSDEDVATLEYKIITLGAGQTAPAYSDISCQYKVSK